MAKKDKTIGEPKDQSAPNVQTITLKATFSAKDQDGNKVLMSYESEGKSIEELLGNIKDYPKGLVALVNVTVKKGSHEISRALAPYRARLILENKDAYEFDSVFRGL